jgi:hypothetical protein
MWRRVGWCKFAGGSEESAAFVVNVEEVASLKNEEAGFCDRPVNLDRTTRHSILEDSSVKGKFYEVYVINYKKKIGCTVANMATLRISLGPYMPLW